MNNQFNIFENLLIHDYDVINLVYSSLKDSKKTFLTYLNQHSFNIYQTNKMYRNLLENKFSVYAADTGINLANRWLFNKKYKQINGTDLNKGIIENFMKNRTKFFILGGNFNEEFVTSYFKSTEKLVGYYNGYFEDSELWLIAKKVNDHQSKAVLIGMGVPKQEIIADKLSRLVDANLFLCVGNFFEFYFGTVKRVSPKFRNTGLEWIYRLFQEPKRLWKRYIIGIPLFIFRIIRFRFSSKNI